MAEEKHPIGKFLDLNRSALAALYLYEHPEKNTPITMYEMETWICQLIDDGMRQHYEQIAIMNDEVRE